jgi:hypothetical protein
LGSLTLSIEYNSLAGLELDWVCHLGLQTFKIHI